MARRARVGALTLEHPLATPETVHVCHHAGLHVLVWTVDDPGRMQALRAAGVDGITTNRVDLLAALDTRHAL
jgi:glycerophosphoryl diester phosphodiesterase